MSPSIHAQATGSSVVSHGYNVNFGIFDGISGQLTIVQVVRTANNYVLNYTMFGPTSGIGSGSIPASSVNVTGSSVNAGNVTFALNVNTCDVAGFTTSLGSCGTFDITWIEVPASVGGSTITSGNTRQTTPGVGTTIINGHTETFNAVLAGTALGVVVPNGPFGQLEYLNNVNVTITK
jgi:hypothetical protein